MVSVAEAGSQPHTANELATDCDMRPLLAWIIICHWAILFGVLAAMAAFHPDQGPLATFQIIGATVTHPLAGTPNPWIAALSAWTVMSTALMFAWALLSVAFSEQGILEDGVVSLAFASGAGVIGLGMLAGFALPVQGHMLPLSIYLIALLASYLAIALPAPADRAARPVVTGKRRDPALAVRLASLTARPSNVAPNRLSELG